MRAAIAYFVGQLLFVLVLLLVCCLAGCAEKCGARERVVCARELVYISGSVPIYGRVCHCEADGAK